MRIPAELDDRYSLTEHIPPDERPVVFVGPFEHHSNELPWRSPSPTSSRSPKTPTVNRSRDLERRLIEFGAALSIGSFSAASNVTGIISDTSAVSSLLHRHGALSFWDFAASAPYVQIEMRSPATDGDDYKDAIFISPHKFIGGPGTPGVLVARRDLLHNRVPAVPGGGTVAYVNPTEHRYSRRRRASGGGRHPGHHRIDPGRPRLQAQGDRGSGAIQERESRLTRTAIDRLSQHPWIEILGNPMHTGCRSSRSSSGRRTDTTISTTTTWSRSSTTCSGSRPAAVLVRRPLRSSAARHRSRDEPSVRTRDRDGLRSSNPAGCGSTSTTSSPTTNSNSSSRRSRSSPTTAGDCSPNTGSSPRPASGVTVPDTDPADVARRSHFRSRRRRLRGPPPDGAFRSTPRVPDGGGRILGSADIEDIPTPDLPESAESLRWFLVPADVA